MPLACGDEFRCFSRTRSADAAIHLTSDDHPRCERGPMPFAVPLAAREVWSHAELMTKPKSDYVIQTVQNAQRLLWVWSSGLLRLPILDCGEQTF
jgi:hypothetical protein